MAKRGFASKEEAEEAARRQAGWGLNMIPYHCRDPVTSSLLSAAAAIINAAYDAYDAVEVRFQDLPATPGHERAIPA
ncbi:MAG: hypothetical protein ACM3ZO_11210 [Clostridia bacterium]